MASLGDMFITVGARIDGFERAMGTVGQRLRAIDRDVNKTFGGFAKIGDKLSSLGQSLTMGVTLPLAAAGGAATKMAADFDLGLRKVGSLVGGFTAGEMKAFEQQTLAVSRALGIDAVKATDALYEAISAGVPKDNAVEFLAVASKAAIAGVTDTKVAVDALTSVINAYQLSTSDAKNISDQMFQAVNIGKFTFEQLASSISIVVPLASQMGVGFDQVLGAAATLTSQGFSISEAMTSVRSAMVAILTPNKQMNELFREAGIQSGEALLKTKGFQGAIETLRDASKGNNQVLTEAYGRVEALGAGLGLTGDKAGFARQQLESVRHATDGVGAATAAYNEINRSAARQFENVLAQLKATAIELGVSLLPAISSLLRSSQPLIVFLSDAVKWFTALPEPVQTFALGLTAAVAVIGPLTMAIGTMITGLSSAAAAFISLSSISGMGAIMPALAALPGMFSNVAFAVSNGLTGALSGGEAMLLRFGQAALVAGAAFAGWKLGEWARNNIPAVQALGDAVGDLILKIPGVETALLKMTGASAALTRASGDLEFATKKLEESLKKKGIVIDKAGKSADEYRDALQKAAKELTTGTKITGTASKEIDGFKKAMEAAAQRMTDQQKETSKLSAETKKLGQEHTEAGRTIRQFQDGIPSAIVADYERRLLAAKRAIAETTIEHRLAEMAGRTFGQQLETNIQAAQKLAAELGTQSTSTLPKYVAGIGDISKAMKTLPEGLRDAVKAGEEQFGKLGDKATEAAKETKGAFDGLGKDISTVFTNAAQSIAKAFFDGNLSVGEKMKTMLSEIGQAVLSRFIEPATKAIGNFITGVISDLLSGRGLGGVIGALKEVGEAMGKVFGIGGSAAGAAGSAAGGAGSAAGSAAGGAGQVVGAGISSVLGAIGSIASAVSGIIGNFQMSSMNKTLGLIEESTRYVKIWTGEQSQSMLWCLQTMTERSGYMTATLDSLAAFASQQLGWMERIGAVVEAAPAGGGPGSIVNNGGIAVSLNNVSFGSQGDIDYLIEQIAIRMRETGQTI
jgi:TP901 family phage tail tape measure protein